MSKLSVIGVDLAKNTIQVSVVSRANKELQNKALSSKKFAEFLANHKPSLVAFEACATAIIERGRRSATVTRRRSYRPGR